MRGEWIPPEQNHTAISIGAISPETDEETKVSFEAKILVLIAFLVCVVALIGAAPLVHSNQNYVTSTPYGKLSERNPAGVIYGDPSIPFERDPFRHFTGIYPYAKPALKMEARAAWVSGTGVACQNRTAQELLQDAAVRLRGSAGKILGELLALGHPIIQIDFISGSVRFKLSPQTLSQLTTEPEILTAQLEMVCDRIEFYKHMEARCEDLALQYLQALHRVYNTTGLPGVSVTMGPNKDAMISLEELVSRTSSGVADFINAATIETPTRSSIFSNATYYASSVPFLRAVMQESSAFAPMDFEGLAFAMAGVGTLGFGLASAEEQIQCDTITKLTVPNDNFQSYFAEQRLRPIFETVKAHLNCSTNVEIVFRIQESGLPSIDDGILVWRYAGFAPPISAASWDRDRLLGSSGSIMGKLLSVPCSTTPERDGLKAAYKSLGGGDPYAFFHGYASLYSGERNAGDRVNANIRDVCQNKCNF